MKEDRYKKQGKAHFLKRLIRGEIFDGTLERNLPFLALTTILCIIYIGNGYQYQQLLVRINQLKIELRDTKFRALTQTATLMDKSRQSKIEQYISQKGSKLEAPTNPPFVIK